MSAKIMGKVWDLDLPHNKLIVLLALADHADHEGNNVYPSQGLIAWKTGYSVKQVRRIIQELVKDEILVEVTKLVGIATHYSIDLKKGNRSRHTPRTKSPTLPRTKCLRLARIAKTAARDKMSHPPRTFCPVTSDKIA